MLRICDWIEFGEGGIWVALLGDQGWNLAF
jgi:hypothetical protein